MRAITEPAGTLASGNAAAGGATAGCFAPYLPFGFSVGVTGHRVSAASRAAIEGAGARMAGVLAELARAGAAVRARDAEFFAPGPGRVTLVSPLADGADQLAARLALDHGFVLEAILPFPAEVYETDFDDAGDASRFRDLLGRADALLELPGDRENALDAYVNAGRAMVAHSDVVIALWDGAPARGRGGTAEIVEHALRRGSPVIHVHIEEAKPTRILWTGYDEPPLDVLDFCDAPERPFDAREVELLLERLLAPPPLPAERDCIRRFHGERERRTRARIEYPILLALLGVRRLRRSAVRVPAWRAAVKAEWSAFHAGVGAAEHDVAGGFAPLEEAYCWADKLAEHFAVAYRSGHVLNYVLGALATLLALGVLIAPAIKGVLEAVELGVIVLFIANTRVGLKRGWHRRWLDYRHLAEQLRPMRSLKLCALGRPPAVGHRRGSRRWIDWYAAGFWRAMGAPHGRLHQATLDRLSQLVIEEELLPQLSYHTANAQRMHHVEHRLHRAANVLFVATLVSLLSFLGTHIFLHGDIVMPASLAVINAGLPAIGAALHGIREQGEFARTALRSAGTAHALQKLVGDLSVRPIALTRAATLTEEAARVMLDDVGEWRMAYEMRNLALPA